jgi:hypothetical protein
MLRSGILRRLNDEEVLDGFIISERFKLEKVKEKREKTVKVKKV